MIRENLFQTKENAGIGIRDEDNERGFIITPLAKAKPIKVTTNIAEMLERQGVEKLRGARGSGS